jgi:hypothetical protein
LTLRAQTYLYLSSDEYNGHHTPTTKANKQTKFKIQPKNSACRLPPASYGRDISKATKKTAPSPSANNTPNLK